MSSIVEMYNLFSRHLMIIRDLYVCARAPLEVLNSHDGNDYYP
jgi:hypothetical protein